MPIKQYGHKELVMSYINTQRTHYVHDDFKKYYLGLFKALEIFFDINISAENLNGDKAAIFMLFQATVRSYLKITTPWSNFLDSGLIVTKLENSGELGQQVLDISNNIDNITETNKNLHLQMLHTLFEFLYGKVDKIVTSEDLMKAGFDDTQEPNMRDYWDYV